MKTTQIILDETQTKCLKAAALAEEFPLWMVARALDSSVDNVRRLVKRGMTAKK